MKQETLEIDGKTYTVSELKYKDVAAVADLSKSEVAKALLLSSTGLSEEEYDNLSMKDGIKIMEAVNTLNGLGESVFPEAIQTSN